MNQGCVNMSLEISSHSRIKDKQLLSLDNCSKFYCRFALVHIDYKLMQFTYANFTTVDGHVVQILQKTPINTGATLRSRFVHISRTDSFSIAAVATGITDCIPTSKVCRSV